MPKKFSDTSFAHSDYSSGEYFKIVRLKTGDTVLCKMTRNVPSVASEMYLELIDPVLAVTIKEMKQQDAGGVPAEIYHFRPWVGLSDSREQTIGAEIVLLVCDMKPRIQKQYLQYLKDAAEAERLRLEKEDEEEKQAAISQLLMSLSPTGRVRILKESEDI